MAVVGLERTFYSATEGVQELELCVTVHRPSIKCPIAFLFDITIFSSDDTAGIIKTDNMPTFC